MNSLLLTGATGLLGSYVMRDALLARIPLAVLVRPTGMLSATERIEAILQYWESQLGRFLPRPVVVEGDLHQPDLALSQANRDWVVKHCNRVLHSAASVSFLGDERSGEPFLSNVDGTKHLLDLCRQADIETFHYVSTAYVAGRLNGPAREVPPQIAGADFRSPYERSKAQAEQLVRSTGFRNAPTFFRPSIIVGDSQTGFSPAYQSIYTALRLGYLHLLANLRQGWELDSTFARRVVREQFIDQLGLTGKEKKNLTPVDWVAAAIIHCVQDSQLHGQTYHLANPRAVSIDEMSEAMVEAVLACWREQPDSSSPIPPELLNSEGFREQMESYRFYFETDSEFDTTNSQRALGHLPCPTLDHATLVRLWKSAVQADFAWRPSAPVKSRHALGDSLQHILGESQQIDLQLQVSGPDGGSWRVAFKEGIPVAAALGEVARGQLSVYLSSDTLANLLDGQFTVEESICRGLLVIPGGEQGEKLQQHLQALLQWLRNELKHSKETGFGGKEQDVLHYSQASTLQDLASHATNGSSKPTA